MHKKALTVAIAGALAAPLAAQAVDFTLSGQLSARVITTSDDLMSSTMTSVGETSEAGNRFRFNGSTDLDNGLTVGTQFELATGNESNTNTYLRHANAQVGGAFGKFTIGQGSEAGDGSAGTSVGTGVYGIRTGANGTPMPNYFGSLNAGSRQGMVRYDTPAIGPAGASVSAANGDRFSAQLRLNQDVGGSELAAELSTLQLTDDNDILGASVGLKMPSGLIVTGAWGSGSNNPVAGSGLAKMAPMIIRTAAVDDAMFDSGVVADGETMSMPGALATELLEIVPAAAADDTTTTGWDESQGVTRDNLATAWEFLTRSQQDMIAGTFESNLCVDGTSALTDCVETRIPGRAMVADRKVDPSYVQLEVGYNFGDTTIAASWYQSEDFIMDGSEGTAIGIGVAHALPKAGATVFAATRKYDAENPAGMKVVDSTVFQAGIVVTF